MRYKNDPRIMKSRFSSTCEESGKAINKGEEIIYYPTGRHVYLVGSAPKAEKEFQDAENAMAWEDGICSY